MSKRFIISVSVFLLAILGVAIFLFRDESDATKPLSRKALAKDYAEYAARSGQTNQPTQVVLLPLKLSEPVRLAVGGLGMADDEKNRQLGDLVTVELSGAPGFALVERESLAKVLQELQLSWSGLVRAKDAVRVGKLLKVDWFLLGTEARIAETNCLVARIVDARTGIIRDAGVFPAETSPGQLARALAGFLRQARQAAATAKLRTYLAIGAFYDVGVNNRQADFTSQLRGYLTAAYRGGNVTLLERESVEILLRELNLDLAGLTDATTGETSVAMQSAFWLVTGQYQSYETTNVQVEVELEVHRVFGRMLTKPLRGAPGEPIEQLIKLTIDDVIAKEDLARVPTRNSEARLQLKQGEDIARGSGPFDSVLSNSGLYWSPYADPQTAGKLKRRLQTAIQAFETTLLLEPTNREAKLYLANCLGHGLDRHLEESLRYYQELIDEPVQDRWTATAEMDLSQKYRWPGPDDRLRWLKLAASQTTNPAAAVFYQQQIQVAEADVTVDASQSPEAATKVEQHLFEQIRSADDFFHHKAATYRWDFGMGDYLRAFEGEGPQAARRLAELLPRMIQAAPELKPYLVTCALGLQPDTNTPIEAEFERVLTNLIEHPKSNLDPERLWGSIEGIYEWCWATTNYPLAVIVMEGCRRAGVAGQLNFEDEAKIKLAYAYLAVERWKDALDIFECYSNRPLRMGNRGPWGEAFQPLMTERLVRFCRGKLGQASPRDPREFEMGKPVLRFEAPSFLLADDTGLWLCVGDTLRHLDFELRTNLSLSLPIEDGPSITALCQTKSELWLGTADHGLIAFNKVSHQFSRFTENDGLLMNSVSGLDAAGNWLWIIYRNSVSSGLGVLDLTARKPRSFMGSLEASRADTNLKLSQGDLEDVVANAGGSALFLNHYAVLSCRVENGQCEKLPKQPMRYNSCIAVDAQHWAAAGYVGSVAKNYAPRIQVVIENMATHESYSVEDPSAMPNGPTTVTLDGNDLWVGCNGAIAVIDLKQRQARRYGYLKVTSVDRIQIAGGYVWALADGALYRAPLSALQ